MLAFWVSLGMIDIHLPTKNMKYSMIDRDVESIIWGYFLMFKIYKILLNVVFWVCGVVR